MEDIKEATIEHTAGDNYFTVYSSECVMMRRLRKLASEFPERLRLSMRMQMVAYSFIFRRNISQFVSRANVI